MNYRAIVAAMMAVIIGGGLYLSNTPEKPVAPVEQKVERHESRGFGVIDMARIQAAHPNGEELSELLSRELRLRLELNEAMKVVELPKIPPPETASEVFDEAAWQKNAQLVISQMAELEIRRKVAAEEYRKESEPRYIAERDKINGEFLNENLNIQLKLKNADNLQLTQEQIDELLKRLDEVELQRNGAQLELLSKWKAEIEQHANESVAADEKRLREKSDRLRAQVEEQERRKESDVTVRNRKLMEDSLREMEQRQVRRRELLTELQEVSRERAKLEKKILDAIADKASMLAAVNRLEMVFVKRKADDFSLRRVKWNFEFEPPARVGAVLFSGKDTRDLTDDVIKEMSRL